MGIRKWFLAMNLQRKVRVFFLLLMAICILFCFYLFYVILETNMEAAVIEKEGNNRVSITKNCEIALDNLNSISRLIMLSSSVTAYLTEDTISAAQSKAAIQDIYRILNSFNVTYSVTVLRMDQSYINTGVGITYVDTGSLFYGDWIKDITVKNGGYLIKTGRDKVFRSNTEEILTFIRSINDINTQKEIGILAINIPVSFFGETYAGLSDNSNHFAFFDKTGYLISSDKESIFHHIQLDKELELKQTVKKRFFKESILTLAEVPKTDFVLVTYSQVEILEGLSQRLALGIFIGILFLLLYMNFINTYIASNVTIPIQRLVASMSEVQKGWLHRVSINVNNDEIGLLKDSYNAMLIEINHLIEELIQKEKNLQKAELDALHEQIKPHFLYNTLDTIRYLALENKTDKVYQMLETLASFYRSFLSEGRLTITLREEIGIARDYLTLQKYRYEDVFEVEYDIEEEVADIRIPRLILQPLVENAIYHGIRLKGEKGLIKLTAYKKDHLLYVKIYDSGVGMNKEQIQALFQGNHTKSFGFKGTMERIRYYYKTEEVFDIHSIEGEYCEIELKLPCEREDL
ncbi:histidine kinase [Anaerocolumna cellulosilytica]|uniref:Histidine kinase n=1 Tax=Anaerocolumna cellulosilytica TaxID=433286 RepID=A0A6S6R1R3_9FIRM|nr:sensor histidine kinase [Anaerocolumna cellulosilytica]MBB5197198.1 two-component system sensor histidine kinase YesM [Anaerocolumna cellulosilytica]BCJ94007.1 histidine kinase [Anaerocolumna cellulosilytica]